MNGGYLKTQLAAVLGQEGLVRFCQEYGGTRVYVPHKLADDHDIVTTIGRDLADKLSRAMAPCTIRVPLARRERALYYRAAGMSDAQIARRLGITENGVGKLFSREADLPDRPGKGTSPAQLTLL